MKRLTLYNIIGYTIVLMFLISAILTKNNLAKNDSLMPNRGICAHRGAMETHPENTIPAFKEAIRLGAHMIEFDVQLSKDGYLVIMHDATLERTTNGEGEVKNKTLRELKALDCGNWKSEKFKGTKIPTLKEVLSIMPKNIWLNIHLKGGEELGEATAEVLVSEGRIHQGVIACGSDAARGVKKVDVNILICNMERQGTRKEYVGDTIQGKYPFIQFLKKRNDINLYNDINQLKKHNVQINYYHSDSVQEVKELFEMGIDFILTNKLSEMLDFADSMGIERLNLK